MGREHLNLLLLVIVPMIIFIIVVPPVLLFLEYRDWASIEIDKFKIGDRFLKKFQERTELKHVTEAYYKIIDVQWYMKFKSFESGTMNAYQVAACNFPPFISLFTKFDYRLRRMSRLAILMFQTNLI